jgi:hypothetical protein
VNKRTPYWLDFLRHPAHTTAVLAGLAGSLIASLPWGGDAFALGLLAMAAIEIVAVAFVPSHPAFREWADDKERRKRRAELHERLMQEIDAHGGSNHLQSFTQMEQRVASLYRMAGDASSTLTRHDVEQLEDATLDYLRLCLSDAVMKDSRRKGGDRVSAIESRLREVRVQLSQSGLSTEEVQQLRRAEADFAEALARQGRMASRKAMLEASLVSMPVRMEEVYQMVMTSPRAGNLGTLLEDSLSKLRITEEVSMELDNELGLTTIATNVASAARPPVPVPRRAANTTRH